MSDGFEKYMNTDLDVTPFEGVVFGAQKNLLEVELNESQEILYRKFRDYLLSTGDWCQKDGITVSETGKVTLNGLFCINGYLFKCDNLTYDLQQNAHPNNALYVDVQNVVVDSESTLYKNGIEGTDQEENPILDERMVVETTKRRALKINIFPKYRNIIKTYTQGNVAGGRTFLLDGFSKDMTTEYRIQLRNTLKSHLTSENSVSVKFNVNNDEYVKITFTSDSVGENGEGISISATPPDATSSGKGFVVSNVSYRPGIISYPGDEAIGPFYIVCTLGEEYTDIKDKNKIYTFAVKSQGQTVMYSFVAGYFDSEGNQYDAPYFRDLAIITYSGSNTFDLVEFVTNEAPTTAVEIVKQAVPGVGGFVPCLASLYTEEELEKKFDVVNENIDNRVSKAGDIVHGPLYINGKYPDTFDPNPLIGGSASEEQGFAVQGNSYFKGNIFQGDCSAYAPRFEGKNCVAFGKENKIYYTPQSILPSNVGEANAIVGGKNNKITYAWNSSIVGGLGNLVANMNSVITGGSYNYIGEKTDERQEEEVLLHSSGNFISGGCNNYIQGYSQGCTILGGEGNKINCRNNSITLNGSYIAGSFCTIMNTNMATTGLLGTGLQNVYANTAEGSLVIGSYNMNTIHHVDPYCGSNALFVIGNGTSSSTGGSNAFSVGFTGNVACSGTVKSSGTSDYAEMFEWEDGNPESEDRIGHFVTFAEGDMIRYAEPGDEYVLGIVSAMPTVLGNGDCDKWNGAYKTDEFMRRKMKKEPILVEKEVVEEDGTKKVEEVPLLNEDGEVQYRQVFDYSDEWDPSILYIPREHRPEWDAIGMMGVLSVYDDGTCVVGGYAKVAENGTATKATGPKEGYRVIKRMSDNVVRVVFR